MFLRPPVLICCYVEAASNFSYEYIASHCIPSTSSLGWPSLPSHCLTVSPVGPGHLVTYKCLISVYLRDIYSYIHIFTIREITVSLVPFTLSPTTRQHGTQLTAVVSSCFKTVSQFCRVFKRGLWELGATTEGLAPRGASSRGHNPGTTLNTRSCHPL